MESDNAFERLWKLQASANQLVLEGKRSPEALTELYQKFVFGAVLPDIDWSKVYETLGMGKDYAVFKAANSGAKEDPGFWFVPCPMGVSANKVVEALRKLGVTVYVYVEDLDKDVTKNDRNPNDGSYVVGFRRTVEADEENANKSANDLAKSGHKGTTLLERLLLELGYFLATGKHLDIEKVTLCAGSRCSVGSVPSADWSGGGFGVGWYSSDDRDGSLRSRSAVS